MSKKTPAPLKIAPLQRVIAEPITDPAEQAALDKVRMRQKRKLGGPKTKINGSDASPTSRSKAKRKKIIAKGKTGTLPCTLHFMKTIRA